MVTAQEGRMRVAPGPWLGAGIYLAYLAVVTGAGALLGGTPGTIPTIPEILAARVMPHALGAALLVGAVTWLGWWRPVLGEARAAPLWGLAVFLPLLIAVGWFDANTIDWSLVAGGYHATLLAAACLAAGCAEILTRGIVLCGLRASLRETAVWFWTSLLFALLPLPGSAWTAEALVAIVPAFLAGTVFYLLRRLSGTLILPILVHSGWEFLRLGHSVSDIEVPYLRYLSVFGTCLAALVLVAVVLRPESKR